MNERLAEMNRVPVKCHIGKTVSEVVPSIHDPALRLFQTVLQTSKPVVGQLFVDETVAGPGVKRYFKSSWYPVGGNQREIIGVGVVIEDITDDKRCEGERREYLSQLQTANEELRAQAEELKDARAEAEMANASKDRFMALVSHELRTPLQNIIGYTHLLASGNLHGAEAHKRCSPSLVHWGFSHRELSSTATGAMR